MNGMCGYSMSDVILIPLCLFSNYSGHDEGKATSCKFYSRVVASILIEHSPVYCWRFLDRLSWEWLS